MKILLINMTPFFHNSSANVRMCGVISGLVKNGHVVDVVTMKAEKEDYAFDYSKKNFMEKYINNYYEFEKNELYQSLKEKKERSNNRVFGKIKNVLKKIYKSIEIYDPQIVNVKNIFGIHIDYNKYDRIVSISDPKSSNRIVYELIKKGKILHPERRWIQYWGDPWLIDMTQKYGLKKPFIKKEEAKLLSMAYKVAYASPFTLIEQRKIYKEYSDKMICVNQPSKNLEDRNSSFEYSNTYEESDELFFGYVGGYNENVRNIKPLYDCCLNNDILLDIVGNGDKSVKSIGTVRVFSSVSQNEAEEIEKELDVVICLCNRFGTQIPGKIFYVASLQKPVIVIVDGDRRNGIKSYLESFNRYILCDNNKSSIYEAIQLARKEIISKKKYTLMEEFYDTYCAEKLIK